MDEREDGDEQVIKPSEFTSAASLLKSLQKKRSGNDDGDDFPLSQSNGAGAGSGAAPMDDDVPKSKKRKAPSEDDRAPSPARKSRKKTIADMASEEKPAMAAEIGVGPESEQKALILLDKAGAIDHTPILAEIAGNEWPFLHRPDKEIFVVNPQAAAAGPGAEAKAKKEKKQIRAKRPSVVKKAGPAKKGGPPIIVYSLLQQEKIPVPIGGYIKRFTFWTPVMQILFSRLWTGNLASPPPDEKNWPGLKILEDTEPEWPQAPDKCKLSICVSTRATDPNFVDANGQDPRAVKFGLWGRDLELYVHKMIVKNGWSAKYIEHEAKRLAARTDARNSELAAVEKALQMTKGKMSRQEYQDALAEAKEGADKNFKEHEAKDLESFIKKWHFAYGTTLVDGAKKTNQNEFQVIADRYAFREATAEEQQLMRTPLKYTQRVRDGRTGQWEEVDDEIETPGIAALLPRNADGTPAEIAPIYSRVYFESSSKLVPNYVPMFYPPCKDADGKELPMREVPWDQRHTEGGDAVQLKVTVVAVVDTPQETNTLSITLNEVIIHQPTTIVQQRMAGYYASRRQRQEADRKSQLAARKLPAVPGVFVPSFNDKHRLPPWQRDLLPPEDAQMLAILEEHDAQQAARTGYESAGAGAGSGAGSSGYGR